MLKIVFTYTFLEILSGEGIKAWRFPDKFSAFCSAGHFRTPVYFSTMVVYPVLKAEINTIKKMVQEFTERML